MTSVASGAEGVRWDLTPLAPSEQAMKERLEAGVAAAAAFVERWPVDAVATIDAPSLATVLGLSLIHISEPTRPY